MVYTNPCGPQPADAPKSLRDIKVTITEPMFLWESLSLSLSLRLHTCVEIGGVEHPEVP